MTEQKIALVTGANTGIGLHVAEQLAARGFTVYVGSRNRERGQAAVAALTARGLRVALLDLDVDDDASIAAAAAQLEQAHGRLDVLVNNAGITSGLDPASTVTRADLRRTFETNLFGLVATTNAFIPLLRAAGAARIVNVSSEVGLHAMISDPDSIVAGINNGAYQASKSAVDTFTILHARELAEHGIAVDSVGPGYRATALSKGPTPGAGDPAEGAAAIVAVAAGDHPGTGRFFDDHERVIAW
jgi:NAD(P)-dependent dehydrogenase (short-subunit alcohol dehydrogenase family)